jgi:predicted phosphodiesterase
MRALGGHVAFDLATRRRIFVGDVHGCFQELVMLMKEVGFDKQLDQVVSVGDLFRKGPRNVEVMSWARSNNMLCVRGNHEHMLLAKRSEYLAGTMEKETDPDAPLMTQFSDEDFEWSLLIVLMLLHFFHFFCF